MIMTVILMRLLTPGDFGIVALGIIFKELIMLFGEFGISDAVIQKGSISDTSIASGMVLNMLRSLGFGALLVALAPFAADFFDTPQVAPIVVISGSLLILESLAFYPRTVLRSELRFTTLAAISGTAAVVNGLVAVMAALMGASFWAIVYGNIASTIVGVTGAWIAKPFFVSIKKASLTEMKSILSFGYNITLSGIVAWIYTKGDDMIIGRVCGETIMGYYTKAYYIATIPSMTIGKALVATTFPLYSRIKNEPISLIRRTFLKIYSMNLLVVLPFSVLIIGIGAEAVPIVFGKQWLGMIRILQITAIIGLLRGTYGHTIPLFKAFGRPDYYWKIASIQAVIVLSLGIWATMRFGATGMLWVLVFTMGLGFICYSYLSFRTILDVRVSSYIGEIWPLPAGGVLMGFVLFFLHGYAHDITSLSIIFVVSLAVYGLIILLSPAKGVLFYLLRYLWRTLAEKAYSRCSKRHR